MTIADYLKLLKSQPGSPLSYEKCRPGHSTPGSENLSSDVIQAGVDYSWIHPTSHQSKVWTSYQVSSGQKRHKDIDFSSRLVGCTPASGHFKLRIGAKHGKTPWALEVQVGLPQLQAGDHFQNTIQYNILQLLINMMYQIVYIEYAGKSAHVSNLLLRQNKVLPNELRLTFSPILSTQLFQHETLHNDVRSLQQICTKFWRVSAVGKSNSKTHVVPATFLPGVSRSVSDLVS